MCTQSAMAGNITLARRLVIETCLTSVATQLSYSTVASDVPDHFVHIERLDAAGTSSDEDVDSFCSPEPPKLAG